MEKPHKMKMILSWLMAFRLKTLTAALVPILSAVGLGSLDQSHSDQSRDMYGWVPPLMLLSAFCIQIATNLFNDAIDFKKGADDDRKGPTRVTQSGHFSYGQVMAMGGVFAFLALLFGVPLVLHGGGVVLAVGLLSLFLAYGYTGGPFPLAYLGLGDLFVMIFFGLIAVGLGHYLLYLQWSWESLILGYQVGALATVLIAVNNLRDSDTDKTVGKRTLAVLLGDTFVRWEISALIVSALVLQVYWMKKYMVSFLWTVPLLPVAGLVFFLVWRDHEKQQLNKTLGLSALLQLLFGLSFYLLGRLA